MSGALADLKQRLAREEEKVMCVEEAFAECM